MDNVDISPDISWIPWMDLPWVKCSGPTQFNRSLVLSRTESVRFTSLSSAHVHVLIGELICHWRIQTRRVSWHPTGVQWYLRNEMKKRFDTKVCLSYQILNVNYKKKLIKILKFTFYQQGHPMILKRKRHKRRLTKQKTSKI